jgi:hypothetical protein
MNPSTWFVDQLAAQTEAILWAVAQVPAERLFVEPPQLLGEWTAARQMFHLLYYDRGVALPSISLWWGADYPTFDDYNERAAWEAWDRDMAPVLGEFRQVRARQIDLLSHATPDIWANVRKTPWGDRTPYWVVSKTYQHATEHLNNILKIALLWEHYAERSRRIDPNLL